MSSRLLAAGGTGATPVWPLHSSPLIHAQARTCSGQLLSQLWTGPSQHRARPPTLLAHTTTQNRTRHTFTGAPLDPASQSEHLLARLVHGPETHINIHTPFGWVGWKPGAVHPWSKECISSKASGQTNNNAVLPRVEWLFPANKLYLGNSLWWRSVIWGLLLLHRF